MKTWDFHTCIFPHAVLMLPWLFSVTIATIGIANTGSLLYAKQNAALMVSIAALFLYQYKFKYQPVHLAIPFSLLLGVQLSLAVHFSFLPWYSAILLLLATCCWSGRITITKRYTMLFGLLILALLSTLSSLSFSSVNSNPYEYL